MPTYKDRNGRERAIVIDVDAVERCRSFHGVNLYDLSQMGALAGDMMRFLRVVHCVTDHRSDFDEWWKAHTGDAADDCVSAFIEALCDFFPSRLATMVRNTNRAVSRAVEAAWTMLENEPAAMFGALPATSALTLAV